MTRGRTLFFRVLLAEREMFGASTDLLLLKSGMMTEMTIHSVNRLKSPGFSPRDRPGHQCKQSGGDPSDGRQGPECSNCRADVFSVYFSPDLSEAFRTKKSVLFSSGRAKYNSVHFSCQFIKNIYLFLEPEELDVRRQSQSLCVGRSVH